MKKRNPSDDNKVPKKNGRGPRLNKRKLDHFLSSICEAGGMLGPSASATPQNVAPPSDGVISCQGPCGRADWRAHIDIHGGILCVSAAWSTNPEPEKHRDVTLCVTYLDQNKKVCHSEMTFCDSEIRWLMETLWHAPLWD